MSDRDMRPTRFDLTLEYAREFINEWFDQNPLGQIGIVGMRGGIGERVCEMSGKVTNDRARASVGRPKGGGNRKSSGCTQGYFGEAQARARWRAESPKCHRDGAQ